MATVEPTAIIAEAHRIISLRGTACALEIAGNLKTGPADVYRALYSESDLIRTGPLMWAEKPKEGELW